VRIADVLAELAKLKPSLAPNRGTPQGLAPVNGKPSDKITMDGSAAFCSDPFGHGFCLIQRHR
jgi:hypothetical protein